MTTTKKARIVATLSAILSAAVGAGVTALAGCTGNGGSNGTITLPVGSGDWTIWWCDDCKKVIATEGEKPTPDAMVLGRVYDEPSSP